MPSSLLTDDHLAFRDMVRTFVNREVAPHHNSWLEAGTCSRGFWLAAGRSGLLGLSIPAARGGAGVEDFRFNAILVQEIARANYLGVASSLGIHATIVAAYLADLCTPEQAGEWLPPFLSGQMVTAIAMTEPDAGSDLAALRTSARPTASGWVLNGQKTFITNGTSADLFVVAARTDPQAGKGGISLFLVPADVAGFTRSEPLQKIGQWESDTAELFFSEVELPAHALLGERNRGFYHMMSRLPAERLSVACMAVGCLEAALEAGIGQAQVRRMFGGRLVDLQHTRFALAELSTELDVARSYVDQCIDALNAGQLTSVDAAKAKWWTTEMQCRANDLVLQLHGGYGYMNEHPVARAWRDGRVQRIYGGSNETMKDLIGRALAES